MLIDYLLWQNLVANLLIAEIALLTDMAKQTLFLSNVALIGPFV